jgi:hypothetical protein
MTTVWTRITDVSEPARSRFRCKGLIQNPVRNLFIHTHDIPMSFVSSIDVAKRQCCVCTGEKSYNSCRLELYCCLNVH